MFVNRESFVPIYHQIADYLRNQINEGMYKAGEMLPTEAEIMEKLHVSRTTVRQAFNLLVQEGIVKREPGKGTFVSESRVKSRFSSVDSFSHDIERLGKKPGTILLEKNFSIPPLEGCEALGININQPLLKVVRLRTADDEPIAIAISWLNHLRFPTLETLDYSGLSLYQMFTNIGLTLKRASTRIWADLVSYSESTLLGIPIGSPVLRLSRTTYIEYQREEVAIEFVEAVFNGYKYSVEY